MSRTILTSELAKKAVQAVIPAIEGLVKNGIFKRGDLHIVVVDPGFAPHDAWSHGKWENTAILYEHSFGDRSKWERHYDVIARSKSKLSWRCGMPSQIIQERCPHLLQPDDTVYFGSAVRDGLVVGVSGVQAQFDQMIAEWVLEACRALCIDQVKTGKVKLTDDSAYVKSIY